jgi:uncharacterized protein
VRITVRVRPSAGRTAVGGSVNDALVVRVVQATVDGKATAAVTLALAEAFGVARSSVVLISGSRSRTKVFDINGATEATLETLLAR